MKMKENRKKRKMGRKGKKSEKRKKGKEKKGRPYVHLITGDGGGKTTSALGVCLRALGQGKKVGIVQFMKGRKDIGEWKIQKKLDKVLPGNYEVFQFGRKGFVNLEKPSRKDILLANNALGFAKEFMRELLHPDVLVLDEINLALAIGLLDLEDVVELLRTVPEGVDVYLTGRKAPKELYEHSDFVSEIKDIKRPKKIITRKGIEY